MEVSGADLGGVSPNLSGKMLRGRGGQEEEGSRTKSHKARLGPSFSSYAEEDSCSWHNSRSALGVWARGCWIPKDKPVWLDRKLQLNLPPHLALDSPW